MNEIYKLRTFFIFLIFIFFYSIVIFNLYFIQIINANYYSQLAYNQHNITITTNPERAAIYDRNDNLITINKDSFCAFVLPHKIEQPKEVELFLKKYFPGSFQNLKKSQKKFFVYIKRKLTNRELELIQKSNLPDIKILKEPSRYYPYDYLSTIVGITDIDNNGLFGIEKEFNSQLAGKSSTFILDKDARSGHFYFKKSVTISGKESNSIKLTIDKDLQFLAYQELKETIEKFQAKEGGFVILNPDNGHIISMLNLPIFDLSNVKNINLDLTKNKVITNAYEFGSVMKVFVAIAALEEGVVTVDEIIDCEDKTETKIDGMAFTTVKPHGLISFSEVIEKSNNIGIVKVAKRLGPKLYNHYLKFNFTKKIGLPIGGEQKGFINPPNKWSKRSIISLSFGYEITTTLLQLARAFCIIANDGRYVKPKLLYDDKKIEITPEQIYSTKTMSEIKKILLNTVTQGTAKYAQIKGYTIMGKTGTANIAVNGGYSKEKNIYTFVGIVEKDNYKRVVAVYVKECFSKKDLRASDVAAPLFEQIVQKMLIHDKII